MAGPSHESPLRIADRAAPPMGCGVGGRDVAGDVGSAAGSPGEGASDPRTEGEGRREGGEPSRESPGFSGWAENCENRLAQVRLGIASSLYVALQAKHPPSAAHSLRVALICSSWSALLNLDDGQRDLIEVAALLHDIGKIGVPDHILTKPGTLSADELRVMGRHRLCAREILSACCASPELWEIVHYAPAWYNGRTRDYDRQGAALPLGSRLLAIADAYDAMTVDQVHRRALSRESASAELMRHADTQFDPQLVKHFEYFLRCNHEKLNSLVCRRWLQDLRKCQDNRYWQLSAPSLAGGNVLSSSLFHEQLLENMHDGVVFVDADLRVLKWNRAIVLLTGIESSRVEQQPWDPALLQMRDENYKLIPRDRCPLVLAVREGTARRMRLHVSDLHQEKISIDAYAAPVLASAEKILGATLLLEDASSRVSLEERLQSLNEKASQDGLTGVANRAEFDRTHKRWTGHHSESGTPYSVIMCDLDFFKRINDSHGHQAGDEALVAFASLLRRHCRASDFVARYGGEEFVVLCPECDLAGATARAEAIREAWARLPHPMLHGGCLTASFGVTELQSGDTSGTVLRRADRALLQAKAEGRNVVVPAGAWGGDERPVRIKRSWFPWAREQPGELLLQRRVITAVPIDLAAERLRGFVDDYEAQVLELTDDHVLVEIGGKSVSSMRRSSDRPTRFLLELNLDETTLPSTRPETADLRTVILVRIRPKRQRDRRLRDVETQARQILSTLKSYLMAQDYLESKRPSPQDWQSRPL